MELRTQIKKLSLWIFIIPFVAINLCLFISVNYQIFDNTFLTVDQIGRSGPTFPYIDGGVSISRTARVFPTYLIFKPAMFLTSYLLIKYWFYNKEVINHLEKNQKHVKRFIFFGVGSAILLILHSIFLGIKFDNDLYKLFRRVVMLSFIIFEIAAQAYLVMALYSLKEKLLNYINTIVLKLKLFLVTLLIIVAIISIPIISMPGNKFIKHALEWDYFMGVISFYLLTYFMWKLPTTHQ